MDTPEQNNPLLSATTDQTLSAKEVFRRLGPAGPLAALAMILPALGGWVLLFYAPTLGPWLRDQGWTGVVIYVVGFALLAGTALLPTYAQALLAGFAFGTVQGSLAAIAGFTGAAVIGYLIAARASGDRVVALIDSQPKWRAVYNALAGGGFWRTLGLVTLIRVPPNSPFAVTNLVFASTRVNALIYTVGTIVGMTPRTVVAVIIGAGWSEWQEEQDKPLWLIIVSVVTALIVIGIIGRLANQAVARVTNAYSQRDQMTSR